MDEGGGVFGERAKSEEVIEGGDSCDFSGIPMGFAKLEEYENEGGEGESDRSLLVSLPLSSENVMLVVWILDGFAMEWCMMSGC